MTSWRLSPQVHAVHVEDDLVLLHVTADAYHCVPGAAGEIRLLDDGWGLDIADAAVRADLAAAALIEPACRRDQLPARKRVTPPGRSALRSLHEPPRATDIVDILAALADLAHGYWRRPFHRIVEQVRVRERRGDRLASDEIVALADRFHRWIPYTPVSGKCLLRSYMLRGFLRRHGQQVDWVFGVRTWPFQAHCWLQAGDLVLDDEVERVSAYAPILVL